MKIEAQMSGDLIALETSQRVMKWNDSCLEKTSYSYKITAMFRNALPSCGCFTVASERSITRMFHALVFPLLLHIFMILHKCSYSPHRDYL